MHERKTHATRDRLRDRRFEKRIFIVCVSRRCFLLFGAHVPLALFPRPIKKHGFSISTDSLLQRNTDHRGKTDAFQIGMRSCKSRTAQKHNSVGPSKIMPSVRVVIGLFGCFCCCCWIMGHFNDGE